MKIHITGTVMASRKDVSSDLKMKKLQKYELCAYQCDVKNDVPLIPRQEVSDNAKCILWPSNTADHWL
jgi:hypothetical protein